MARNCSKVHTAHAARLFFLIRPIKFLIDFDVIAPGVGKKSFQRCVSNEQKQWFLRVRFFIFYFLHISTTSNDQISLIGGICNL